MDCNRECLSYLAPCTDDRTPSNETTVPERIPEMKRWHLLNTRQTQFYLEQHA